MSITPMQVPASPPFPAEDDVKRALWRLVLRARYVLWQHRRHDRLVLEHGLGFPLLVLPGVFNPTLFRTSRALVDLLRQRPIPQDAPVLDIGTGSGALAIAAAQTAGRVVAVDVNPAAVTCARINALLNGVEDRVQVRPGDLFEAVADERFGAVLCNPPFYRGQATTQLERAFRSPDFAARFSKELSAHLTKDGYALVVLSSDGDELGFMAAFHDAGLVAHVVDERDLISETVRVYRIVAGQGP